MRADHLLINPAHVEAVRRAARALADAPLRPPRPHARGIFRHASGSISVLTAGPGGDYFYLGRDCRGRYFTCLESDADDANPEWVGAGRNPADALLARLDGEVLVNIQDVDGVVTPLACD